MLPQALPRSTKYGDTTTTTTTTTSVTASSDKITPSNSPSTSSSNLKDPVRLSKYLPNRQQNAVEKELVSPVCTKTVSEKDAAWLLSRDLSNQTSSEHQLSSLFVSSEKHLYNLHDLASPLDVLPTTSTSPYRQSTSKRPHSPPPSIAKTAAAAATTTTTTTTGNLTALRLKQFQEQSGQTRTGGDECFSEIIKSSTSSKAIKLVHHSPLYHQAGSSSIFKNQPQVFDRGDELSSLKVSKSNLPPVSLFETSEAQSPILTLAKAVTSTLMIRVYHRCFGKCSGIFYPALLMSSQSHCIECSTCHLMMQPRKFITHTHGSEESNICHWGFNSQNWRHYIRLSKKQTMNNLSEDELFVQFSKLKTVPCLHDQEIENKDDYQFDLRNYFEIEAKLNSNFLTSQELRLKNQLLEESKCCADNETVQPIDQSTSDKHSSQVLRNAPQFIHGSAPYPKPTTNELGTSKSSYYYGKHSSNIPPYLEQPAPLDSSSYYPHWTIPTHTTGLLHNPRAMIPYYPPSNTLSPYLTQQASGADLDKYFQPHYHTDYYRYRLKSAFDLGFSLYDAIDENLSRINQQQNLLNSLNLLYSPSDTGRSQYSSVKHFKKSPITNPIPFSNQNSTFVKDNYYPSDAGTSSSASPASANELETRREAFIQTNLNSFLNGLGLSLSTTNDIVVQTLNILRESRQII